MKNNLKIGVDNAVRSAKDGEILKVRFANIEEHVQRYENEIAWKAWILTFEPLDTEVLPFKIRLYLDEGEDFERISASFSMWVNRFNDFALYKYGVSSFDLEALIDSELEVRVSVDYRKGAPKMYCDLIQILTIPRFVEIDDEVARLERLGNEE